MVQPKYSPEEALKRIKLMMEYDSSKTYSENLNEQERSFGKSNLLKNVGSGAAAGAATGLYFGGIGAVPGAIAGGLLGAAKTIMTSGPSREKCEKLFNACTTQSVNPTLDDAKLSSISDDIYNAVEGMGTDEDKIKRALAQIPTISDFCKVVKIYGEDHESLFDALDDDFDDDSEWFKYFYSPLKPAFSKSTQQQNQQQNQQQGGTGQGSVDKL
jgi:hypothetical protein